MVAIDSSKQQARETDPKAVQQNNFTGYLNANATMFFITKEVEENILDFSQGTGGVL